MSSELEAVLGHSFDSPEILELALTHRSYATEHGLDISYERLEFLGDAVLQLAVTRHLYDTYEELAEGELAKIRAAVVNQRTLAGIARDIDLGSSIRLGQGEESSGGRDKESILADVIEALLGAVHLDGGYEPAARFVLEHWRPAIEERAASPGRRDYKTRLQELLAQNSRIPSYELSESGPDHAKVFQAVLWVDDEVLGTGEGSSKKRAEQAAASDAIRKIEASGLAGA